MVSAHYTTEEDYRAVASNHISAIKYNKISMELRITFANGAVYQYLGIPFALYQGLMASPSHGVFFWRNIRQRFPYNLIKNRSDTTIDQVCPELKQLDALDLNESKIRKKYTRGEIDETQRDNLINVISTKRAKLITRLEKAGYFGSEVQATHTPAQRVPSSQRLDGQVEDDTFTGFIKESWEFKGFFVLVLLFFGVFAALLR
jgi:hypothetical protein